MINLKLKANTASFSERVTDIYVFVMLFAFPLFTGFEGYSEITLSKYIFFVSASALWLVLLFAAALKKKMSFNLKKLDLVEVLILLFTASCCVSAVFSSFRSSVLLGEGRFDGLVTILLCAGIFFGVSRFGRVKNSYIYAAALAVSINCIVAVFQILGYNPLQLFPGSYDFYDAGREFSSIFLGTIGNADLFSAYLCLILPLICAFYISAEKRPLILLAPAFLCSLCLFKSGVSGGILALSATVLLAAPFIITNGERLRRALEVALLILSSVILAISVKTAETADAVTVTFSFSRACIIVLILIFCAAAARFALAKNDFSRKALRLFFLTASGTLFFAGLAAAYFWKGDKGSVYELSQLMHGNFDERFGSSRILIWRKTLELVPEKLLFGGGPGTLALRLDVDFSRFVEETGKTLSSSVDNAHNEYLGILVNTGLVSLAAYLAAQAVSLVRAVKCAARSEFCCCFACALLCYWIQAFFGLGLFLVSPLMWLCWGLLVSSFRREKSHLSENESVLV
ncbi:MAG: O-antigen ligase domain-containing protein [Clostridia bacterium]|nr:O-antigen ligase domain-containing protein [Clostridia bacterium]